MNDPSRGSVEQPVRARRLTPYALPLALAISLGLHAGMALTVAEMSTVPELDFEFGMPDQVEFGMTEAMEAVMVNAPPIQEALDESAAGDEGDGEGDGPGAHATEDAGVMAMDAGVMAGIDGGMDDAAVNDAGGLGSDGLDGGVPLQVADAGPDASTDAGPNVSRLPVASATVHGPARIPAGAQLALRLDMGRLRQSVVANEVRALIAAVPDWQELLGGSGIDPLNDLERVLIATPNRYRSRILVAGRHVHDEAFTRAAVDRMAGARGTQATWATQDGVQVAPWANEGNTPRVLAMLSPQHFTISRSEDLAVALAMTEARAARGGEAEGLEEAVGPDVLLSMGPNEGLSLEIEGVHAFLMSLRARLAIREVGPRIVAIDGVAVFPNEQLAADAIAYWTAQRDGAVQSFAVRMVLGNRVSVLQSFTFVPQGERVEIRGRATADDVRYGLDLARRQFEAWAREAERRRAAAAGGGSTTGTPAATPAP
ncbi:MAG: hypothetical protein IPG81_17650 [Sandaracinaceae bacterium]|nr:hypothetical protein [Sandaracinaceae bacterium]